MKVTHIDETITHAVIGGDESIAMGMSDSAEFFAILYKALYSDQQLAVIRETLCNGWDAHIEAGVTDKSLTVTVNQEELIIRDYGNGIPRAKIGPIYGVMGGSTKVANGEVTGGFGLGCKAPFAYTDHFEVTSWSKEDGQMTIYRMNKSNAEKAGKPGITPIVSVPITDGQQGLQVKIQLKDPYHRQRFCDLIRRIANNGEIKVCLNGAAEALPMLPFSQIKHGFLLSNEKLLDTPHKIVLRYGNVIYPIEPVEEYINDYTYATKMLGKLGRYNEWKLIFQATPNSVSVTPSRETLSMSENTIEEISRLLAHFKNVSENNLRNECFALLKESIDQGIKEGKLINFFIPEEKIPGLDYAETISKTFMTDFPEFVKQFAAHEYPRYDGFRKKDLDSRLVALIAADYGNRGLIQTFRKELKASFEDHRFKSQWFTRRLIYPLQQAIEQVEELSVDKLFIWDKADNKRGYGSTYQFIKPKYYLNFRHLVDYLPFLRNVVILTYNRQSVEDRAPYFPIMKDKLGHIAKTLAYLVPRSSKKVAAARAFFEGRGFTILDLTVAQSWEHQEAAAPILKEYVAKPKRKGLPILSCIASKNVAGEISTILAQASDCDLIDNPEFVIKLSAKSDSMTLPDFTNTTTKDIVRLWGSKGGIVVNVNQQAKYTKAGVMEFQDFVLKHLLQQFEKNPRIRASIAYDFTRDDKLYKNWGNYNHYYYWFSSIFSNQDLLDYFGFVWTLNDEDKMYLRIWNEFKEAGFYGSEELGLRAKIENVIKAIPIHPYVYALHDRMKASKTLSLLSYQTVHSYMTNPTGNGLTDKQHELCRDMLLQAIEG